MSQLTSQEAVLAGITAAMNTDPATAWRQHDDRSEERIASMLGWCFAFGLGAAVFAVTAYVVRFGTHISNSHEVWNQAGGFFGGVLGPTFSFLALFGLLLTVMLQREQTTLVRAQGAAASVAYAHQQFESTFFELLKLTRELQERFKREVNVNHRDVVRSGPEALGSYAASISKRFRARNLPEPSDLEMARGLVQTFYESTYRSQPSAFGPYFRSMYQTFKHIDESQLGADDKTHYANIARGQISEGAVLLLALNGLTPLGHNFIRYIERFGLLEHMHRNYRARFKAALLVGYNVSGWSRHLDDGNPVPPFSAPASSDAAVTLRCGCSDTPAIARARP